MRNKVRLCITEFSDYSNDLDNCQKEQIDGCEGCEWYVDEIILKMFKKIKEEKHNANQDVIL